MDDPTYVKAEIEANPLWNLAWQLSEVDNDMAPIGWGRYINMAQWILNAFDIRKKSILEDVKCPECNGKMVSRTGQYGTFWGCAKYPDCRGTRDSMGRSKAERDEEKNKPREPKKWEVR